jgi:hypothetical protein
VTRRGPAHGVVFSRGVRVQTSVEYEGGGGEKGDNGGLLRAATTELGLRGLWVGIRR